MFTLVTIKDEDCWDIQLNYLDDCVSLTFSPENSAAIKDVNLDTDGFDTATCNGEFSLNWNGEFITMNIAKYGDGEGGSQWTKIRKTPEVMASLLKCLQEWQILFQNV
jgi:hypothetical protein